MLAGWFGVRHPVTVQRMVSPGPLSAKHAFLGASCASCHTPGVGVERAACVVCHANDSRLLGRQPTAFHATVASCSGCHVEHDATRSRPIVMNHELLATLGTVGARRDTTALSFPRSSLESETKGGQFPLLRRGEERLDCASCHATKDPHRELFGRDCATCHATASWNIPRFQHPSSRSVMCVQCHQAPPSHYMEHFRMVSRVVARQPDARVEQCYSCHQTTAWNDIVGVGWYKHH